MSEKNFRDLLLIFAGGGAGAVLRVLLDFPEFGPWMPANFLACFLMGLSSGILMEESGGRRLVAGARPYGVPRRPLHLFGSLHRLGSQIPGVAFRCGSLASPASHGLFRRGACGLSDPGSDCPGAQQ